MKVLAHLDPQVLEQELLARVDAVHPTDGVGRTLVVVPTARLGRHLARRLARVRPAWLGLEVRHFHGLAQAILAGAGAPEPRVASRRLLASLLDTILRRNATHFWAAYSRRRPGVVRRLLASLNDLREAGIEPQDVTTNCAGTLLGAGLAELFCEYHNALEARSETGWTDAAGLARAARPHAAAWGHGLRAVFVHGAYEVVGVHLDLLRDLDQTAGVTALVALAPGAPASLHAERFARQFLLDPGGDIERIARVGDPARAERLAALYDEEARPPAAPAGAWTFRHAQGPTAEVQSAVRAALVAVGEGCPPEEIAIVARSLEPYAAALEEVFGDLNLPWTSSLGGPLRRHPIVRDFLLTLGVVAEGFPRRATAELLRSPRVGWSTLNTDGVPRGDRADLWSRKARILGGLDEWTADLARWAAGSAKRLEPGDPKDAAEVRAARRLADVQRIGVALSALAAAVPQANARWGDHATGLRSLFDSLMLPPSGDGAAALAGDALRELLDDMARLETVSGDLRPVAFDEVRTWLEQAVDGTEVPAVPKDQGGFQVLDAMQFRGLTFRRVYWLGLNSDLFPRLPREDVALSDALRRALRSSTKRPLPIKAEGLAEERLLLILLVGSATEEVHFSWQRADESGRARTPSPALREIARLALGRPDAAELRARARHLPSHPLHWLQASSKHTGLLAPAEAMLLTALQAQDEASIQALGRRWPGLAPGLRMLQGTQSFAVSAGEYDARIGPLEDAQELSVSALEQLGRCPLQFFFSRVLGVGEFEEEASPLELQSKEIGTEIHAVLEAIYRTLGDEGLFDPGQTEEALVERGVALLGERQDALLGDVGARLARRLPLLGRHDSAKWAQAIERFLRHDLARIRGAGWRLASLEELRKESVDLGHGISIGLRGKFDRLLTRQAASCVGDYKVSASLERRIHVTSMLRGEELQAPLYRKMAGPDATVELMAIHPRADPEGEKGRATFSGFQKPEIERSFDQTLRVLVDLWRSGSFPFREHELRCRWCNYQKACRRHHPASVEREKSSADTGLYRSMIGKSTRKLDGE